MSEAELSWLYEHATCVLFPSEYEGLGMPVIEAVNGDGHKDERERRKHVQRLGEHAKPVAFADAVPVGERGGLVHIA